MKPTSEVLKDKKLGSGVVLKGEGRGGEGGEVRKKF